MVKIVLFCAAGMSTSMLISKIKSAAQAKGIEVSVDAYPEAQMAKYVPNADVVLLGPQIRYALQKAKKLCDENGVPLDVINPQDYGMMKGDKVLEQALKLVKK